jgi:uncharacterized protein YjbI with pentapeptide repeats
VQANGAGTLDLKSDIAASTGLDFIIGGNTNASALQLDGTLGAGNTFTFEEGADLSGAHLEGALLAGAHLEGADLSSADGLTQAQLWEVEGDAETTLPKGLIQPARWNGALVRPTYHSAGGDVISH